MDIDNILFDLDGTLIDSKPGIVKAYGRAISEILPSVAVPDISAIIGPPMPEMFRISLQLEDETVLNSLITAFKAAYDSETWQETIVYTGVPELLQELYKQNKKLFVVTNKRKLPTLKILDHFKLLSYFIEVVNPDSFEPAFANKTSALAYVMQKYNLQNKSSIFVGDSFEDAEAAENNDTAFVAANYGYGQERLRNYSGSRMELSQPLDLLKHISKT